MSFILAPGSRTGVYYLIFAGLHRSATWKDVKDYLRDKHIEANHVEVYQNFLGGWVRVLGLECYEQLCRNFHAPIILGKPLIVHAPRPDQPIPLLGHPPQVRWPANMSGRPCSPMYHTPSNANYEYTQPFETFWTEYHDYSTQQYWSPSESIPYYIESVASRPYSHQVPDQYVLETVNVQGASSVPRTSDIMFEMRKVVLKKLPRKTTDAGLEDLIVWAFDVESFRDTSVEGYELVRNDEGKFRSYAYIFAASFEDANFLIRALDGLVWDGSKLQAKLASEGAPPLNRGDLLSHEARGNNRSRTPAIANGSGSLSSASGSRRHRNR